MPSGTSLRRHARWDVGTPRPSAARRDRLSLARARWPPKPATQAPASRCPAAHHGLAERSSPALFPRRRIHPTCAPFAEIPWQLWKVSSDRPDAREGATAIYGWRATTLDGAQGLADPNTAARPDASGVVTSSLRDSLVPQDGGLPASRAQFKAIHVACRPCSAIQDENLANVGKAYLAFARTLFIRIFAIEVTCFLQ